MFLRPNSISQFWLLVACCMLTPAATFGTDLERLETNGLATVRLIQSIEFTAELKYSSGQRSELRGVLSGENFYFDHKTLVPNPNRKPFDFTEAYNGKSSQVLFASSKVLRVTKHEGPPHMFQPLFMPYSWLTIGLGEKPTLTNIRNGALWSRRFESAVYVGESKLNNDDCDVVSFPQQGISPSVDYIVYFSQALGCFPIKYERRIRDSNQISTVCDVKKYSTYTFDGRIAIFPTLIDYSETHADGHSAGQEVTMTVDPSLIAVNEPIDQEIFTIPELRAVDKLEPDLVAEMMNKTKGKHVPVQARALIAFVTAVTILSTVLLYVYRRFNRRDGRPLSSKGMR